MTNEWWIIRNASAAVLRHHTAYDNSSRRQAIDEDKRNCPLRTDSPEQPTRRQRGEF